jgi:hypothetical protein
MLELRSPQVSRQSNPQPRCPPSRRRPVMPMPSPNRSLARCASPLSPRRLNPPRRCCHQCRRHLRSLNRSDKLPMKRNCGRWPRACKDRSSRNLVYATFHSSQCLFHLPGYVYMVAFLLPIIAATVGSLEETLDDGSRESPPNRSSIGVSCRSA